MTEQQIKNLILKHHWEPWLKRPFYAFIMSTFIGGSTKEAFKKINLPGWHCNFLLSDAEWYKSDSSYAKAKPVVLKWLKKHSVTEISYRLEKYHKAWADEVKLMSKKPGQNTIEKLARLEEILREVTTYIWATHIAEHFFTPLLKTAVTKNVKGDADKFIGDASFPSKLNAAAQMVQDYKRGVNPKILAEKFGWMRARDGFARPYTAAELAESAKHTLAQPKHKLPQIPKKLEKMLIEARELVYLRTLRTDINYELMFLAKPILKVVAKKYKIPFEKLKDYTLPSLISAKPQYCPPNATWASLEGHDYYLKSPVFDEKTEQTITEIKGTIAQTGLVRGPAKVVMSVKDLPKVKQGDILVTYMTSPNFLPAMRVAAGFVTNEGGLTCHAAIVAREMKKPCVIGTKIATQIFKDGDLIEVDANKGIVKKLK